MSLNNRDSNAPTNMLPYIRELEAIIRDYEERLAVLEARVRGIR